MARHNLTALQRDVLRAFFRREERFYLTGGAALVGFYFGHRKTEDLDFFTVDQVLDDGTRALEGACQDVGATAEKVQDFPDKKRYNVRRGDEFTKVDIVFEVGPQWRPHKPSVEGIRLDPPEEILANKICTLPRREVRDLVDIMMLERAGHRLEDAFPAAMAKERGLGPEILAWVLSDFPRLTSVDVPDGISVADVDAYRQELIRRFSRIAFPGQR